MPMRHWYGCCWSPCGDDGATDEQASLVRRHGERLFQLLTRHDQAIDKALTLGILSDDEINH